IRRIGERTREALLFEASEAIGKGHPAHLGASGEAAPFDVLLHEPARLGALIDEEDPRRPATQRLEAERPAPGEEVEPRLSRDVRPVGEDVENRRADLVRRRTNLRTPRNAKRTTSSGAAGDSHAKPRTAREVARLITAGTWARKRAGRFLVSFPRLSRAARL